MYPTTATLTPEAKKEFVQSGDSGLERAVRLMYILRNDGGCPWDIKQTHQSLRKYLLEETYELADAIEQADDAAIEEELGDVLLQVLFHARIANQDQRFDIHSVADRLVQKMIYRHPHVFDNQHQATIDSPQDVSRQWEQLKAAAATDQNDATTTQKIFGEGLPLAMPALARGQTISDRAAQYGFDWPDAPSVVAKLREETDEISAAMELTSPDRSQRVAEEIGDALLCLANLARKEGLDAESIMRASSLKFQTRFRDCLSNLPDEQDSQELSASDWDALWQAAKAQELG